MREHTLVYIDPPYYLEGPKLYRFHYKERNHKKLAIEMSRASYPWLISYDEHDEISKIYPKFNKRTVYLNYAVKSSRSVKELLISNQKLVRPRYETHPSTLSAAAVAFG